MINVWLSNPFIKKFINFNHFFYEQKVKSQQLKSIRYRIITTLDEFKKNYLIQLAFFDNPGDLLSPLSLEKIKKTPDIIEGMHPVDINTINDLYYLLSDKIIDITINKNDIIALKSTGQSITYNLLDNINPDTIESRRLAYLIGYMQAEKLMQDAYQFDDRYKIVKDNVTTLEILDVHTNKHCLKSPVDILFSDDYKNFSKKDIGRIGFICGQMSRIAVK